MGGSIRVSLVHPGELGFVLDRETCEWYFTVALWSFFYILALVMHC